MSHADRVKDVIATGGGGVGNITLAGTPPDATYRTLAAVGGAGATADYWISDGTNMEVGVLTVVSTNVFSRAVALSTNGNAAVNWTAGVTFQTDISAATMNALVALLTTAATLTGTQQLTNKRIVARVATPGSSATPLSTINTDSYDEVNILALAVAITAMTFSGGAPNSGDKIAIHITDNGTARAITWGTTSTEDSGNFVRPTATPGGGQKLSLYFDYNAATSKWRLVGIA